MIHFVDGDEDGNFRRFRVIQRLDGLRHDAVVRRDDQHDDVGDVRAAGAHGAERRVAGRVEERDLRQLLFAFRVRHGNGVGADVLRDAAGLARRDVRFADDVEQRGFAVVNVAHDGDDRRARLEIFRLVVNVEFDFFLDRVDDAFALRPLFHFKLETVFRAKLLGDFFVNRLVDGGENAQLDQIADDDERLLFELLGEFADDDRRLDDDDLGGVRQD